MKDGEILSFISDVTSPFSITNALYWLATNAQADTAYIIVINADETIGPVILNSTNLNGKTGIKITFKGLNSERIVQLSSQGALFTVENGVMLNLDGNITLRGRSDNNVSLIRVNSGATLTMENGSKISGNTSSSANYGGGVSVSGTFVMNGGEISGNTASVASGGGNGGGVNFGNYGTFTMNSGEISGNTSSGSGGGIHLGMNVTFTMSDGEISGNTVSNGGGGGVYLARDSTFTMSGGEIFGNSASSYGGGVWIPVDSIFKKQPVTGSSTSGVIYGYTASDIKSNKIINSSGVVQNNRGHAVCVGTSKKRETTTGATQNMDSTVSGAAGGWE
jgi:parallel beta-helix repeat protein